MASPSTQMVQVPERKAERVKETSPERPAEKQPETKGKPFVVKLMGIIPN